jgi:hypothetical protein
MEQPVGSAWGSGKVSGGKHHHQHPSSSSLHPPSSSSFSLASARPRNQQSYHCQDNAQQALQAQQAPLLVLVLLVLVLVLVSAQHVTT